MEAFEELIAILDELRAETQEEIRILEVIANPPPLPIPEPLGASGSREAEAVGIRLAPACGPASRSILPVRRCVPLRSWRRRQSGQARLGHSRRPRQSRPRWHRTSNRR
ncbi:hypothetical protein ACSL103130_12445 [Actinomyces slackii]|uniref:Uncharacterized protein n=1 Tax=Actinomyces slackii TaxID=52774 RepID=A0A448KDY7_9ACTO|nr:Uncharacterised protein [Actinomyces slackii]